MRTSREQLGVQRCLAESYSWGPAIFHLRKTATNERYVVLEFVGRLLTPFRTLPLDFMCMPPYIDTSRVRELNHRTDEILLWLLPLAFAFAARHEQVLVIGVGEGRGGLGWAGLRQQPTAVSFERSGGPCTTTIDLLSFPSALASQTSKGSPVWRVAAGCMRDIFYETDCTFGQLRAFSSTGTSAVHQLKGVVHASSTLLFDIARRLPLDSCCIVRTRDALARDSVPGLLLVSLDRAVVLLLVEFDRMSCSRTIADAKVCS